MVWTRSIITAMKMINPSRWARLKKRITSWFETRVYIYEDTRIEIRRFPPKFRITATVPLQKRIETSTGIVHLEAATYLLDAPVSISSDSCIKGKGMEFTKVVVRGGHHYPFKVIEK